MWMLTREQFFNPPFREELEGVMVSTTHGVLDTDQSSPSSLHNAVAYAVVRGITVMPTLLKLAAAAYPEIVKGEYIWLLGVWAEGFGCATRYWQEEWKLGNWYCHYVHNACCLRLAERGVGPTEVIQEAVARLLSDYRVREEIANGEEYGLSDIDDFLGDFDPGTYEGRLSKERWTDYLTSAVPRPERPEADEVNEGLERLYERPKPLFGESGSKPD